MKIERDTVLKCQKEIDTAAETLAKIFIQQILMKKGSQIDMRIESKDGQLSR